MTKLSPVRSIVAVLVALMLLNFMDATFAQLLVSAVGDGAPGNEAAFLAVRNRPFVLVAIVVTHVLAALLVGYILGRIAGTQEVRHGIAAAIVITVVYAIAFVADNAMLPPVWVRAAMLVLTPPALMAGAHIRGEARAIHVEQAGTVRGQEERRHGVPEDRERS